MVASAGSAGVSTPRYVEFSQLTLDSGETLAPVRVAYETWGQLAPARDNVVLVCHALSADAHAAGWSGDVKASTVDGIGAEEGGQSRAGLGWWDNLIGPGKAFDTDRYFVICSNVIGSCRGSTGPCSLNPLTDHPYGTDFPVITVGDMVRAQRALLAELGIDTLHAVAGGSLGGMQALEWAVAYPEMVRAAILTASTACLGAQGVALNAIARSAIMADPAWRHGHYYGHSEGPDAGIGIARMIGHVTYLSARSLDEKFGRRLQRENHISYTLTEPDFAVESYLRHQATSFARRFDANSYLYISRALTLFDLARTHGNGSLRRAVAGSQARFLLISFTSDWIYPPADSAALTNALRAENKPVERHVIDTSYGHDSFLLEGEAQTPLIAGFLAGA